MSWISRTSLALVMVIVASTAIAALSDRKPLWNTDSNGVAAAGYDVVAYATQGAATRGRSEFEYSWQGARWRFASAANRDEFRAAPERYAPQFGGYCAWAVSRGYTADIDPDAWRIVEGKLYLNYSKRVQRMWERDVPGNIAKGQANWPGVLAK